MLNSFVRILAVGAHLSARSVDGVEVFIESTVAINHVEDDSVTNLLILVVIFSSC